MDFTCNIGRKGRALRIAIGSGSALAGAWLLVADVNVWLSFLALFVMAKGAFMIFEGAIGWCVIRAMGRSTPI